MREFVFIHPAFVCADCDHRSVISSFYRETITRRRRERERNCQLLESDRGMNIFNRFPRLTQETLIQLAGITNGTRFCIV